MDESGRGRHSISQGWLGLAGNTRRTDETLLVSRFLREAGAGRRAAELKQRQRWQQG